MQLTVLDILNAQKPLANLATKPLPAKTSFRVAKLLISLNEEVRLAEAQRIKLVEKYGTVDDQDPKKKTVLQDNLEPFKIEFSALLQEKVEINFTPMQIDDLGNIEISPVDLHNLTKLFVTE